MPPILSIAELLAAAQERELWPEVEPAIDAPRPDAAAHDLADAAPSLQAAVRALCEQTEQTLGGRRGVVSLQLAQLRALVQEAAAPATIWAALDELEDQLETLLRD
jgi:hypothetical protein